jgi:hypothetical protein
MSASRKLLEDVMYRIRSLEQGHHDTPSEPPTVTRSTRRDRWEH